MSKTLKTTSLETQYGRPIFEDAITGEKHSELSTTFQYKGKWVNMPTLHNGKIYTTDQLIRLLNINDSALDGGITSTHTSKSEAEQAAKSRSNNMKQTAAKTTNANYSLSNASVDLITADPGFINRDAIKLKNDKILSEKQNRRLTANNKPKPIFTYNKNWNSKEKTNDFSNLKKLTPNYGEMPGFKQPLDAKGNKQGHWDADEKSDFWKTDAGYAKALQTWGKDGNTLPQFVKKPVKKELDIKKIKSFFSTSNNGY